MGKNAEMQNGSDNVERQNGGDSKARLSGDICNEVTESDTGAWSLSSCPWPVWQQLSSTMGQRSRDQYVQMKSGWKDLQQAQMQDEGLFVREAWVQGGHQTQAYREGIQLLLHRRPRM